MGQSREPVPPFSMALVWGALIAHTALVKQSIQSVFQVQFLRPGLGLTMNGSEGILTDSYCVSFSDPHIPSAKTIVCSHFPLKNANSLMTALQRSPPMSLHTWEWILAETRAQPEGRHSAITEPRGFLRLLFSGICGRFLEIPVLDIVWEGSLTSVK